MTFRVIGETKDKQYHIVSGWIDGGMVYNVLPYLESEFSNVPDMGGGYRSIDSLLSLKGYSVLFSKPYIIYKEH